MPKQRKQTLLRRLKACIAVATVVSMTGMQSIAYALPAGGVVSAGDAAIVAGIAQMDIHQASSHAVLDWNSFNIAQGEGVTFYQPSSSAIALNRIHDINPSTINGNLTANGNVWLLNTQGVMFGQSAVVNVGGLLATTADISNEDFMQENYVFDTAGDPDASVVNEGTITIADHGLAALVAPKVRNSGTIRARLGKVELASGDTFGLDLYGDGLLSIEASDAMVEQIVEHTGLIEADGGVVTMTAGAADSMVNSLINMEGTIVADSVGGQEGEVVLYAAGSNNTDKTGNSTVLVAGDIKARGNDADEKGGKVTVTGDHVGILAGAEIDASGQAGGGTVLIGGDYQGQGDTPNAKRVIMQDGANIYANALGNGDGGKVILWADDRTDFAGYIEARGGPDGGDGGFVETSGKNILSSTGLVDASSPNGNAGTWLLDPNNITIQAAGSDTNVAGAPDFTTSDDSAIVTVGSIETALNAGTSVTITTGTAGANAQAGDITVADAITK